MQRRPRWWPKFTSTLRSTALTARIGRVLGIRIALHPTWLVIAFLVTYALAAGDLPSRFPGWIGPAYFVVGAAVAMLFFAAGTWQFGPDSNLLRFFPEPFWYEIALVAGVTILVGAVLVALLGVRDLRRGA